MQRRTLLSTIGLSTLGAMAGLGRPGAADAATPGVSATEIKIGNTEAYSGPASAYGAIGHGLVAYFKMVNDQGGVGGRKINFITVDDGYSPPRTVEQTRRLVEQDGVAFILNALGTPNNTAIEKYMNAKKVPQLFVATGADKWGDYQHYHWTMGWQPSYRIEAAVYAKDILANKPGAKIGILYQNDDFGKDYIAGMQDGLGAKFKAMVVKTASYEVTDPTIDSQIVTLQGAGADTLLVAATPKFAAQAIRKVFDINWKPLFFMTNVSSSVGAVIKPAGFDKAVGVTTVGYAKDPTDAAWANDAGMQEWRGFMAKYMPNADLSDANYVYAYGVGVTTMQVLRQCGKDFSRANIMKQAANLHDLVVPTLLPGIKINTSPTNYHPIRQMQLQKWNGKTWERFGQIVGA
ncbi:MAG: ABC transporter substrate-binding protein [Rhodospirillales bacterium]|nr:ABC transporter substrate-binding protein [Rhodospirillales bacterium]MDE2197972.1 ABC transporter substrate-binding protein [Rhodospirillales bacterium]MDE2576475.1 ABC transporter substrate-binding protein [Rhodospirillales bacterium]